MADWHERIWQLDEYTTALGEAAPDGRILARQVAGPGARFLAGLIDFAIQCVMAAVLAAAVYWKHPHLVAPQDRLWFFGSAMIEWHILYFMLFEAFTWGRTPGKNAMGIGVVDVRSGGRATSLQLLGRNLLRAVDILPFHYLAGAISMMNSPARQRLGDRLCATAVIYRRSLVEQLEAAGVPESNYSTSDDGYLLEAFVKRAGALHDSNRPFLTREVARYFQRKYPAAEPGLKRLYEEEQYGDYLQRLCKEESDAASLDPKGK